MAATQKLIGYRFNASFKLNRNNHELTFIFIFIFFEELK